MRILAVDDDKIVHKMIARAMPQDEVELRATYTGEEGISAALAAPPSVILLDVELPDINGYEVCTRLRRDPSMEFVPILFVSSHSSLHERMLGYEVGGDDYVVKPFEGEALLAKVRVLNKYAQERRELHEQVTVARETAMTALSSSGELGHAVQYLEKNLALNNIDDSAEALIDVMRAIGLSCRLLATLDEAQHWYSTDDAPSPIEKDMIVLSDRNQRFIDFGAATLVHYPAASLLVKNMPLGEPERYGRIKDLLPVLLSGLNTKLNVLVTQDALATQGDELIGSVRRIRNSLYALGTTILKNRTVSTGIMQELTHGLSDDLLRMGLEEDQEDYLMERVDTAIDGAIEGMDAGMEISGAFRYVLTNLNEVVSKQENLIQAFEDSIYHEVAEHEVDDSNIELF